MRSDVLYLRDIIEASDSIAAFRQSATEDEFSKNDMMRSAVLQKLIVIGEAAAHVGAEVRGKYPEIEWQDVVAMRNFSVHAYFGVVWPIIWVTATEDVPVLRQQVIRILGAEYPEARLENECD